MYFIKYIVIPEIHTQKEVVVAIATIAIAKVTQKFGENSILIPENFPQRFSHNIAQLER